MFKKPVTRIPHRDLIGQKFGKLTVLDIKKITPKSYVIYNCECLCGNKRRIYKSELVSGKKEHCGCDNKKKRDYKPRNDIKNEGMSGFNYYYSTYKRNAKKRNKCFLLTKDDFFILTKQRCFFCDTLPNNKIKYSGKSKHVPYYICNGVDRLDNNLGYTIENSVPCCSICNRAKGTLKQDTFEKWIDFIRNGDV